MALGVKVWGRLLPGPWMFGFLLFVYLLWSFDPSWNCFLIFISNYPLCSSFPSISVARFLLYQCVAISTCACSKFFPRSWSKSGSSWDSLRSNTSARRYVSQDGTSSSNPPQPSNIASVSSALWDELTLGFPKVLPSSSQLYIYTSRYVLRLLRSSSTAFLPPLIKSLLKCRKLSGHSFCACFDDILLTLHSFVLLQGYGRGVWSAMKSSSRVLLRALFSWRERVR
jgi:hypothetical protein